MLFSWPYLIYLQYILHVVLRLLKLNSKNNSWSWILALQINVKYHRMRPQLLTPKKKITNQSWEGSVIAVTAVGRIAPEAKMFLEKVGYTVCSLQVRPPKFQSSISLPLKVVTASLPKVSVSFSPQGPVLLSNKYQLDARSYFLSSSRD